MRSNSFSDTNLLLSTVTGLCLGFLLKPPQFLDYVGRGLAELWWLMRHIW